MALELAHVPAGAPRAGGAFARWLGRTVLRLGGWRVTGAFPDVPRAMIIAAPHSSMWDAVWGLAAKLAMGLHVEFMAKQEAFFWPLGAILRALGGFPVDRRAATGVVDQLIERVHSRDRLWMVIAPEGTRRRVERWKTGFWKIAMAANLPVVCVTFHYPDKTIGIGPTVTMSGDLERDMATLREFYRPFQGKHRGTV
jgi:1-acyl-sn-glycerol-3-phosphate acyltransferase